MICGLNWRGWVALFGVSMLGGVVLGQFAAGVLQ